MLSTCPVNPARVFRGEQRHHRRHVAGLSEPAQRIKPDELVAIGLDPVVVMRGLDQTERKDIHSRAEPAEFSRQRL